jgi:hypothetical protein
MRVAMLTTSYPKFPGDGTAPFIERMAEAVASAGHAVNVVLPRHPDLVTDDRRGAPRVRFFPFFAGPARPHRWGYASSMAADRRLRGAALAVAIVVRGKGPLGFDAGRAAQNMMLAAWSEGIGSCPNGISDSAAMAEAIGLQDDDHFAVVLSFGYPAREIDPEARAPEEWIARADRKPVDEVVERR